MRRFQGRRVALALVAVVVIAAAVMGAISVSTRTSSRPDSKACTRAPVQEAGRVPMSTSLTPDGRAWVPCEVIHGIEVDDPANPRTHAMYRTSTSDEVVGYLELSTGRRYDAEMRLIGSDGGPATTAFGRPGR